MVFSLSFFISYFQHPPHFATLLDWMVAIGSLYFFLNCALVYAIRPYHTIPYHSIAYQNQTREEKKTNEQNEEKIDIAANIYLGVSSCTDNKLDSGLVRKHGAKSSSTRSPWQPVCSATLRFT